MVKGIAASGGIAIGKAFVLPTWEWELNDRNIDVADLAKEFERLYEGINTSKHELEHIKQEVSEIVGREESNIFDAHLAILNDPVFMNEIKGIIQRQYKAAEVAVKEAIDNFVVMFDLLDDEYMKERALDIKDVGNRLLKHLLGAPEVTLPTDTQPFILVARELSPSQLAHLNPHHVLGIVTMMGGKTSHAAIMARAMGIPSVLGLEGKLDRPIQTGDLLIVDGDEGVVHIDPDRQLTEQYTERRNRMLEQKARLQEIITKPSVTRDGITVNLAANINSSKELDHVLASGANGVGLFRTELLYMDRQRMPDEEEQFEVYRRTAEKLGGRPLVIRTIDIGGDKQLDYFPLPEEDNPFLGYRAIRICLDQTALFKIQLRAILRAGYYGKVKIMFPMITSLEEVLQAKSLLEEAKRELQERGMPFDDRMEVGIMIEVPAAVAIADWLADEVDFFSIGTNDLVQYVLAVDRMNEKIAHLYDPYHPAVVRMLKSLVQTAKEKGVPISVCGEMAGDLRGVPLWIALGVTDLSMSPHSILQVKQRIRECDAAECRRLLEAVLRCRTSEQIGRLLDEFAEEKNHIKGCV
jgi:phosphotransferase system enzyme I (PtsI)